MYEKTIKIDPNFVMAYNKGYYKLSFFIWFIIYAETK